MVTRRVLLKGSAFGAMSLAALSRGVNAMGAPAVNTNEPNSEPHFFVFVQMQGAWDPCLAFDPKDREALLANGERGFDQPYAISEVQDYGAVRLAPMGKVLSSYADRMAIINGIDMEVDTGHVADTVMSGMLLPKATNSPFIQAVLTKRQPYLKRLSMPHIYTAYDGNFFGGPYGAGSVTSTPDDLLQMLGSSGPASGRLDLLNDLLLSYREQLSGPAERRAFAPYLQAVPDAQKMIGSLKDGAFTAPADATTAEGMGKLFGQLFARGIVGSMSWQMGGKYSIDTHGDHYKTHQLDKILIDVATLMAEFSKIPLDAHTSVADRTTVVLASEFSRTPRLNSAQGKDHNEHSNTLVFFGHRVRAGVYGQSGARQIGGSTFAHSALPIDLKTGQPSAQGELLKAKNVWAGLGAMVGADLSREFGVGTQPIGFLG